VKKPTVNTRCGANRYSATDERIIEFSDGNGKGGLISFIAKEDGTLDVCLYRMDQGVVVHTNPTRREIR
jgi:hypothetical protein